MADHSTRPRQRRYPPELKERAVRLVEQAPSEGERHGAITRVAHQLDIGPESVPPAEFEAACHARLHEAEAD